MAIGAGTYFRSQQIAVDLRKVAKVRPSRNGDGNEIKVFGGLDLVKLQDSLCGEFYIVHSEVVHSTAERD